MKLKNAVLTASAALFMGAVAHAETFPTKPVRVILPFPAGTGPDSVMRLVGEKLTKQWGQQVVVDNRPGGNGWIAMEAAKRSAPDGYTLVQVDTPLVSLMPHLYKRLPYDPAQDFEPVATLFRNYYFVTVASDSKWKNVSDLVDAAKAKPGEVTYGSSGTGGNLHLGGAMLEAATKAKMNHIPYKDTPQIYIDVSKGDVSWAMGTASTTAPLFSSGKVKYLAVTSPSRLAAFPDVPTVAEARGPAGFELKSWVAIFAPRGAPKPIIEKINMDIAKVLQDQDVRARMLAVGFDPFTSTPPELQKVMNSDSQMYKELVNRLNITLE
ncbi:tripartite tricarboxylate transporter substrate binding protein [Variovorax guangxiensis]|uniref:Bug family tripartite tricarboxylate transporter substrate binding protein n=1 Tax=Variovorax guangxiensis TaxID=1775474 RepID=UPI002866D5A4|nr:tripartite tricarboxylate transporter substrate binding protein [Variovorax guangxiensis]MDR6858791.1 tripartite-type tricarboxylate transporter receptor subunit TctC [Variovorax guangxiensis]